MEKGLVIKTNSVLQGSTSKVFNELNVAAENRSTTSYLNFKNVEEPFTIKSSGGLLINGSTEVNVTAGSDKWVNLVFSGLQEGAKGKLCVPNMYKLASIQCPFVFEDGTLGDLEWINEALDGFRVYGTGYPKFDIQYLVHYMPNLKTLYITNNVVGNVNDLLSLKETLTDLYLGSQSKQSRLDGSFDDLGHLYKVTKLFGTAVYGYLSGSVEGFVANRLEEAPATAGSVTCLWLGSRGIITWEGTYITEQENNTIAWDAQGNITVNGNAHNPNA